MKLYFYPIIFAMLLFPFSFFGQEIVNDVTFTKIPVDLQLVARDTVTNLGDVLIEGQVDNTLTPFNSIQINIYRTDDSGTTLYNSVNQTLTYDGNLATFNFIISIESELANYSFDINGLTGGSLTLITNVVDVVAGDVYIINGQSNAAAKMYDIDDSANGNQDNFIRVFERGSVDVERNEWFIGQGDKDGGINGNTGQWGLKFAKLLVESNQIPIAIFNGALGTAGISDLQAPSDYQTSQDSNYGKLYYRLNKTGLKEHVRAILFSQGEKATNSDIYKSEFLKLKTSWKIDYPNIKKIYIFQTKNGCSSPQDSPQLNQIKEAQRKLAFENTDIHIMSTAALKHFYQSTEDWYCHFGFTNGYEEFGTRIYELVKRDFYGGSPTAEIEPPMITTAYLTDDVTLVVETDAVELLNNSILITDFALKNADGSTSSTSISSIDVSGNKIIFSLSEYPGENASISYYGPPEGVEGNFITNSYNLELVCFYKYSIDVSRFTVWDGSNWVSDPPETKEFSTIKGNYFNSISGGFEADNLTINSGVILDFDGGTSNSIIVHGDLTIDGTFIIGDTESLIMYDDNAVISGEITKAESSAPKEYQSSVTYWSSPVENEGLNVFTDVDPDRIFILDPSSDNPDYTGDYDIYKHWFVATSEIMGSGIGYSIEGDTIGSYPNLVQEVTFTGTPNNGSISVPVFIDTGDGGITGGYDSNLIGNPYPSAIDADLFINSVDNQDVFTGTLYFWSQQTEPEENVEDEYEYTENDYEAYNLTVSDGNIGSGQGFVIIAQENGEVTFNNTMRIEDSGQFFKSEDRKVSENSDKERDRIWLKLKSEPTSVIKEILIGFFDKATDDVDYGYDALSMSVSESKFYSVLNNRKYEIQGLGSFDNEKNVVLGVDIAEPGDYSVGISNLEGVLKDSEIYLVDNLIGITHDFREDDYQFNQTETGEFKGRFTLQFAATALEIDKFLNVEDLILTNTVDGFKIRAGRNVEKLRVFDMLGRLLLQTKPNQQNFDLNLDNINDGTILIFEITLDNGAVLSKRGIRY